MQRPTKSPRLEAGKKNAVPGVAAPGTADGIQSEKAKTPWIWLL